MDSQIYEGFKSHSEDDPADQFVATSPGNDDREIYQPEENDFPQMSSEPNKSTSPSSESDSGGRKKHPFTLILKNFKTSNGNTPKRDNINVFIIRAITKAFGCITSRRIPKNTSIKINIIDERQMIYWNELGKIYRDYTFVIDNIPNINDQSNKKKKGKVSKKPKIMGEASKEPEIIEEASKEPEIMGNASKKPNCDAGSNKRIKCQEFFSKEPIQQAFYCLIEIFYSTGCPTELCERFHFSCCDNMSNHKNDCMSKWDELKKYLNNMYIEDLSRAKEIQTNAVKMENEESQ